MMRKKLKYFIIGLIGILAVVSILGFSVFIKYYFIESNKINYNISRLQKLDNELNYEVLSSSMYLYYDNDVISNTIHKIHSTINNVENIMFFKSHYPEAYKKFIRYESLFNKKENMIFEFLRFNFPLKNALIYMSNSLNFMNLQNKNAKLILNILSNVFLSKSAIDQDFIKNIKLKKIEFLKNSENPFERAFYKNLQIYVEYFPAYKKYLSEILSLQTEGLLKEIRYFYLKRTQEDIKYFNFLSFALAFFILILITAIAFFVTRLEKTVEKLTYALNNDILTDLPNRYKFNNEILKKRKAAVAVFNIDKFKNINDYFGNDIGDKILNEIGKSLQNFFDKYHIPVFRIGADDFAVIFENWNEKEVLNIIKNALSNIEKKIILIGDTPFNFSISVGVSFEPPYLENADIALKHIKKDINEKIGVYSKKLNEEIKVNIVKTKEIKEAIENNNIIPYFQPIFDKNGNIVKYELLCRIKIENEIKSIFPYLTLLKEIRLYHRVTEIMLTYAYNYLEENKFLNLSVNLSLEDLLNNKINDLIKNYFSKEDIAKRITFEILESEIKDYNLVEEFVEKFRKYGAEFAIDDFGSGYSNFHRIMSLDINYLKIDGSLIKNIDKDKISRNIVESIVWLAEKSNKKTVAEFVHSKEVFEVCKEVGIDYFQGFYLGEPSPDLINVKKV